MGHVRDLPAKKMGIDLENNFKPEYELMFNKKTLLAEIVRQAKKASEVVLATDPDREGEAIAEHIKIILSQKIKKVKFSRIVFHEITQEALEEALKEPSTVNKNLFDAQQARRILDRLFGYKLSPYLWKRFAKRWLSAGRVQSVALRFIVEREKERSKFLKERSYPIKGQFQAVKKLPIAKLVKLKGKSYFQTKSIVLFDGKYDYQVTILKNLKQLEVEKKRLLAEVYTISRIEESLTTRQPPPPFTTSALQQYASSYLGYSAKRTMRLAQSLYELGLITYHRTDSNNLADKFINEARSYIKKEYGSDYVSQSVRRYKTKSKLAQEAHEAIRPTNLTVKSTNSEVAKLNHDQIKLYQQIYNRALSTQMSEAKLKNQKVVIESNCLDQFTISSQEVVFPGYLVLYDLPKDELKLQTELKQGSLVKLTELLTEDKETQPPPYYNEASLIKTLESRGIGRPSTYAPIVSLIQERQYVDKKGRDLIPTQLGISISDLLTQKFDTLLQPVFTAKLEDELDSIALGESQWAGVVKNYYQPFSLQLEKAYLETEKIKIEEKTDKKCPDCGKDLVIKISRFGKFYACSGFPECKYTENFLQLMAVNCPKCNKGQVVMRFSKKKRRFYACSRYPECDFTSLWLPRSSQSQPDHQENQTQTGE
jgi:DNA topoisomerase-1